MRSRRADWALAAVLAAVSYIPLFLSRPGSVAADTKQYLYLDPTRLTSGAASMWDPNTGLGTVTHQNVGYLFPMGPYYSAVHWAGIPMWIGQRLWMGSLVFLAGLGVAYCARKLGLEGIGRGVASLAYALSPYVIDYLDRISAILMPWAALGWMIGLTIAAARTRQWRYAAAFGLVVAAVGGVNATSILLVLIAPALWLLHGAFVTREVTPRTALSTAGRIGLFSFGVSLWWAAGLWAEGRYGLNVLRVTETVPTVARTSSAAEVLRGLGYWYFYGWDKVQPWTLPAVRYTQSLWLLGVSLAVPGLSVALGFLARWRYRSFAVALVGVGTLIAVGAFPYAHPSLFGGLLKTASAGSTVALAMRSVDRIVPLVVLGLSLLMGSGVAALELRATRLGYIAGGVCIAVVATELPALWTGGMIASNLSRPSAIPSYWTAAAKYMNSRGTTSRVLGIPGEDFAAYSWGVTQDPIAPGLLTRAYVSRQVVPTGTPAAANLVQALDEPIQEGTLDMSALAPIARLMSAGQILLQSDLQYERYHLPLPQVMWLAMQPTPPGLGEPAVFGTPNVAPTIRYPLDSELRLGIPTGTPEPPALAVFNVSQPRAFVRAESARAPLVVAGDGSGLVESASAGLLQGDPAILYSASLSPTAFDRAMASGAVLVVTDTNTLGTNRWGSLRDNTGQVEQPGVRDLTSSASDYSLPVFPGATDADRTVAELSGYRSVQATDYGDSLTFTPENRPMNAVDGDPATAWTYGAHAPVAGGRIQIDLDSSVTTDHVTLLQAQLVRPDRRISAVTLRFDGRDPMRVQLTPASFEAPGQTVSFPRRSFSQLEVTVDSAGPGGADKRYDGLAQVGFAEIAIPGVGPASEDLLMPTRPLSLAGSSSLSHTLVILMQRNRAIEPPRHDPEPDMARAFVLPTARTFSIGGTAEINADDSDNTINQLVGLTPGSSSNGTKASVVAADSSTRLDEDRSARANAALDGNPASAWVAETGPQSGEWLSFELSKPVSFDHLALQVVNDGRHSLPTSLTISTESGTRTVAIEPPPLGNGRAQGSTSAVYVRFAPLSGRSIKVTINSVQPVEALDYYSTFARNFDILPVGIAELGVPGVDQPPAPALLPVACNYKLVKIDGKPVGLEVAGTTSDALSARPLSLRACGNTAQGITLSAGRHVVETSPRAASGWSVDRLGFESAPGGGPLTGGIAETASEQPPATVHVDSQSRTSVDLTVSGSGQPFWLVLGQSLSSGWSASLDRGRSLGSPQLIDGYANGWYVPAGLISGTTKIHIRWKPQQVVWVALGLSALSVMAAIAVAAWPRRRRGRGTVPRDSTANGSVLAESVAFLTSEDRAPARWKPAIVAGLAWGAICIVVSRPAIGAIAGAAVVLACVNRRGQLALRVATVIALLAVPVYAVEQQAQHHYWPTIDWPASLSSANDIAWTGLALLGAELVAGYTRSRRPVYAQAREDRTERVRA